MTVDAAAAVDLSLLEERLASDLAKSLASGLGNRSVFETDGDSDEIFRASVARAIRAIEAKDSDDLLPRFLRKGPYFEVGPIPAERQAEFLTDDEVAAAIRLIHSSVINSFQGALAEMLAVGPVVDLTTYLFPTPPRVFVGDTVLARKLRTARWGKAADFHLLDFPGEETPPRAVVCGVVEVKSYARSVEQLGEQMGQHLARLTRGIRVASQELAPAAVRIGRPESGPIEIYVVPSTWRLSRAIHFDHDGERTSLRSASAEPPLAADSIEQVGDRRWLVTLRWSEEALASVAYEMTFWYMGVLGAMLSSHAQPAECSEMTPEEVGRNAAKMMLYYAVLRARTTRERSRAIALFNSYGFGYALGANFVDRRGIREVLSFEDLQEIAATGRSRREPLVITHKNGMVETRPPQLCRLRG